MREIKFRVWDNRHEIMMKLSEVNTYSTIDIISNVFKESLNVMQFTGLKDKNGVEIYEFDIVEIYSKVGHTSTKGYVYYSDKVCAFMIDDRIFKQYLPLTQDDSIEIIGNIYENKELLESN